MTITHLFLYGVNGKKDLYDAAFLIGVADHLKASSPESGPQFRVRHCGNQTGMDMFVTE